MHKRRLDHLLAGAAVTAVLALMTSGNSVLAQSSEPVLASVAGLRSELPGGPRRRPSGTAVRSRKAGARRRGPGCARTIQGDDR